MRQAWPAICILTILLAIPMLARSHESRPSSGDIRKLIIISPHNEAIRSEFGRAFSQWHQQQFGEAVEVVWNTPGGTSDIRKVLQSQYHADLLAAQPEPGGAADIVFGGGSYEFDVLKREITAEVNGHRVSTTILKPVEFSDEQLSGWYGENQLGDSRLFDPTKYWFGTALSTFGIVYNRDILRDLGVDPPHRWEDLCDPRLRGWVAMINPAQSGSIATAMAAILQKHGWKEGWRILRRISANSRYFSASSPRGPIDVSQGEAAAGICIDFYGRFQSQSVVEGGAGDRVGYVDPVGETIVDPDPVAMLRGAPSPDLAKHFIEFCLTDAAQALWQFRAGQDGDLGPEQFELRRLPIRRGFYERYFDRMIDKVNPYDIAVAMPTREGDFRSMLSPMLAAMAIDSDSELKEAWSVIIDDPAYPSTAGVVTAEMVDDPNLKRRLTLFDAMPSTDTPDGVPAVMDSEASVVSVGKGWLKEGWKDAGLWPANASPVDVLRRRWTQFFSDNYRMIVGGRERIAATESTRGNVN